MRQIYRGNNIVNIDKTQYDLIAVYIGPLDNAILVEPSQATPRGLYIKNLMLGEVA